MEGWESPVAVQQDKEKMEKRQDSLTNRHGVILIFLYLLCESVDMYSPIQKGKNG